MKNNHPSYNPQRTEITAQTGFLCFISLLLETRDKGSEEITNYQGQMLTAIKHSLKKKARESKRRACRDLACDVAAVSVSMAYLLART